MKSKIEARFDIAQISTEISLLEYPGFITESPIISDTISLVIKKNEIGFSYKPIPGVSDRLKITSNTQKRNIIVLKVKKDPNGIIQKAELTGVSQKCHVFRELFDFSAESVQETSLLQSLKTASDHFDEKCISSVAQMISDPQIDWNTFCIPPFKFSHSALPLSSRDIRSNLKISQKDDSVNQKRSWNISFDIECVPTMPAEDCISRAKNVPQEHVDIVAKIFDERPIVSKLFLLSKIKDAVIISNLKFILPLLAYHWRNGPWHLLWVKYGIDPRSDRKYRFYQSVELRNKMFAKELRRGKSTNSKNQEGSPQTSSNEAINYKFDGEKLILNYLTYEYIDLTYQPLQEIVNYPGGLRNKVSEKEGWYPDGTVKKLRDIMKQRWFELLKSIDLSSLPQHKLEEILEITAPANAGSAIGADWNSLNRVKQVQNSESLSEEEMDSAENEDSDYEIFDY